MTATKAELKAAFEAGEEYAQAREHHDGPNVPDFATYFEGVRKANKAARDKARRDNLMRAKALLAEARRRSNANASNEAFFERMKRGTLINIAEEDRPAPPYTKD